VVNLKLSPAFYQSADVVGIARALLGKVLVSEASGEHTAGIIVETEAYAGPEDQACHAYLRRNTKRTAPMFLDGGVAYVYLIYGIYNLFNIVTHGEGEPYAVLVRGVEPLEGVDVMLRRRGLDSLKPQVSAGPGLLTIAMGITKALTGHSLQGPDLWVEDRGIRVPEADIVSGTRVGVAYAKEDAYLPYRFSVRGNRYVSRGKGL
jgi:DNA-3-methyladenine glycosylase